MATTGVDKPTRTRVPGQDSPAPDVVPFGWEPGPSGGPTDARQAFANLFKK